MWLLIYDPLLAIANPISFPPQRFSSILRVAEGCRLIRALQLLPTDYGHMPCRSQVWKSLLISSTRIHLMSWSSTSQCQQLSATGGSCQPLQRTDPSICMCKIGSIFQVDCSLEKEDCTLLFPRYQFPNISFPSNDRLLLCRLKNHEFQLQRSLMNLSMNMLLLEWRWQIPSVTAQALPCSTV